MRHPLVPLASCAALLLAAASPPPEPAKDPGAHPYASGAPIPEPRLFAEGVVSTGEYDSHPEFTPDGATVYFLKSTPNFDFWTIVVSRFGSGRWSEPETAPFSGRHSDADPFITPDGSKLYFISNRPVTGKTHEDLDIWVMEKAGAGWGEPRNLGAPINSDGNEWFPCETASGTLYFGSDRPGGKGRTDIYRSRLVEGKHSDPENLGDLINTRFDEYEAYVDPEETVMLVTSGRPEGQGGLDLYLSRLKGGAWTAPANLGTKVNSPGAELSPQISPDGRYFFFTSARGFGSAPLEKRLAYPELIERLRRPGNGLGDVYQVDAAAVLGGG